MNLTTHFFDLSYEIELGSTIKENLENFRGWWESLTELLKKNGRLFELDLKNSITLLLISSSTEKKIRSVNIQNSKRMQELNAITI